MTSTFARLNPFGVAADESSSEDPEAPSSFLSMPTFGSAEDNMDSSDDLSWLCASLSKTERLYGFAICFAMGTFLSFLSSFYVWSPTRYAPPFIVGNLLSLCASGFLVGPTSLCKSMFNSVRVFATLAYFAAMIATLISALYLKSAFLALVFTATTSCAYAWFCLSYIPFARTAASSCLKSVFGGLIAGM